MLNIQKRYIVDENNKRLAVEIDYETFSKIEEIMEDFALYKLMEEADEEDAEALSLTEAKDYYHQLLNENENGSQI